MKKLLNFFTVFLFFIDSVEAQKLITFRDHCGLYFRSIDDIKKQKAAELGLYNFKPGQIVASVGAQCCHWEAAFAASTDSLTFYLQDIDSANMNYKQASFTWGYYSALKGKSLTSTYHLVIGTEKSTNLPENVFDKILIINTFHEFTFPVEMLTDINLKLKADGVLYIDEALPKRKGQLHGVCNKRMYTDAELIFFLSQHGFKYIDGIEMNFRKKRPQRKIFAFSKA